MHKRFIIGVALVTTLLGAGCSAPAKVVTPTPAITAPDTTALVADTAGGLLDAHVFKHPKYGYTIQYPANWGLAQLSDSPTAVVFKNHSPDVITKLKKDFSANLIIQKDGGPDGSLDLFVARLKKEIGGFANSKISNERTVKLGDGDAHYLTVIARQEGFDLTEIYVAVKKGSDKYLLSATAPTEFWSKYSAAFDAALVTFKP